MNQDHLLLAITYISASIEEDEFKKEKIREYVSDDQLIEELTILTKILVSGIMLTSNSPEITSEYVLNTVREIVTENDY